MTLDFESFSDITSLTNQYAGFVFTNASIWTAASTDGRLPPNGLEAVRRYLAEANEQVRSAKIDLAATYTNQLVDGARQ
jgi:hypothetical protein